MSIVPLIVFLYFSGSERTIQYNGSLGTVTDTAGTTLNDVSWKSKDTSSITVKLTPVKVRLITEKSKFTIGRLKITLGDS